MNPFRAKLGEKQFHRHGKKVKLWVQVYYGTGGKTYAPNGKRECERRMRQMEKTK